MDTLRRFMATVEHILDTEKKRHVAGGILLSASIFFGGLALTVMTTKIEENDYEQQDY